MDFDTTQILFGMFGNIPQIMRLGFGSALLVLLMFYLVKMALRHRGTAAFTSYQQDVIAPVQYGDRGAEPPEDKFARRLDNMVKKEEAYDLARLLPNARELGAIAKTGFHIAPVLTPEETGVLSLIEDVVFEIGGGHRVLLHTSLETLVDLDENSAGMAATRLSIAGITLTFAVVDRYGKLVMAVEHLNGQQPKRQACINRAVVLEVLRKAGVWYLEIPPHYSGKDARAQMLAVLQGAALAPPQGAHVA